MKKSKKWIALFLTCAMVFTTLIGSAFAAEDDNTFAGYAPKSSTTEMGTGKILSGATAAANTTELSILGINVTSTDSAGALNAMSDAESPINLFVFGSDLNEAPDPYLYNFYYNLGSNCLVLPDTEYDMTAYQSWAGDYTLLNYAKSGPSGVANTERTNKAIDILVNGVYMNCNPVFFYEPDVLFGVAEDSYDPGLEEYNLYKASLADIAGKDEDNEDGEEDESSDSDEDEFVEYDPLVIGGWTTDGKATNEPYIESTITMANAVYEDAVAINDYLVENDIDLGSRYNKGDIIQCGVDYSNFAMGIYYYLQSRFNPNSSYISKISKAGYCTGISVAEIGGEITITNEGELNNRYLQYLDGISELAVTGNTYSNYRALKNDVDLIIMDTTKLTDNQKAMLAQVNIKLVDINSVMPSTVYGTTMQSADNILGLPYFVGLLYEGRLSTYNYGLSEYDYLAYFVENIYHVKNECVDDVVDKMVGDGCGSGYNGLDHSYNYNDLINSMIQIGANYYHWLYPNNDGDWYAANDGLI